MLEREKTQNRTHSVCARNHKKQGNKQRKIKKNKYKKTTKLEKIERRKNDKKKDRKKGYRVFTERKNYLGKKTQLKTWHSDIK